MTSMFTRPDKAIDPAPTATATPLDKETAPVTTEPKRSQAVAQPFPAASMAAGPSLVSKALKITGQLESSEDIQIDGEVEGDVRAVTVRVGAGAKVKGTVYGEQVELAGTIDGRIEAKKVVLASSAHMSGDVVHQDITIHSGAYISGLCKPEFGKTESNVQPLHKPISRAHVLDDEASRTRSEP
jgi:cytoskeletal protein CcmA (bactofilin family)